MLKSLNSFSMMYYIIKVLEKMGLLKYFNFKTSISIKGKKFIVPITGGMGQHHLAEHEKWFDVFLGKLLEKIDGGIVDVGVNIGQTLLKVAAINSSIRYIGFEPNPFAFCYAYRLIEENKLSSFSLYYTGLSKEEGTVTLHMDNYMSSGASILPNFRENMTKYKRLMNVPVFRADTIFLQQPSFKTGLLKIDVEGAELEVLKGAVNLLQVNKPVVVLEILPVYSLEKENGQFRKLREQELISLMHSLGYLMYRINEQQITLEQMDEIPVHSNMSLTNYFFVPKEKAPVFEALFA